MRNEGYEWTGFIFFLIVMVILCFMVKWTDSNLDWLLSYLKNQPVNVPMWLSAIITFLVNGVTLLFNIIVSLFRICVS